MNDSPRSHRFITVLFGSLGDGIMALALFDDIVRIAPDASLVILTRRNVEMLRMLASEYPQIEVREIPRGLRALPFFVGIVVRPGWTLLTLGLVSIGYSLPLRLFFAMLRLVPGNRTIGFHDRLLEVSLNFDISLLMIENLRRLLPYALPDVVIGKQPPPRFNVPTKRPSDFTYGTGTYMIAHLFGASIPHALPPERWRGLFTHLAEAHPELTMILTGTPDQQSLAEAIAAGLPSMVIHTTFSIPELAWVIKHAALYIGIDTGVTHLAGMLGQKSLVVSHCMDPAWAATYNPCARVIYNSAHCTPEDPASCVKVEEGGRTYRRCTYDISDDFLYSSVDLALAGKERDVPLFAGRIDESRRQDDRENDSEKAARHHAPKTKKEYTNEGKNY